MANASLYDFRDLDIFLAIADNNGEGTTAEDLAVDLGLGHEGTRAASIRLTWMRRFGMVTFDPNARIWRLTPSAERVTSAKLRAAAARSIDGVPDEQLVEVMAHVTTRWRFGDPLMAQLLRREFLYGTQRR